jgi:hypothetical protein
MAKKPQLQRSSWLQRSDYVDVETTGATYSYFELSEYPDIERQDDDLYITAQSVDRIDRLAHKYYGDPRLWWVIATRNGWDQPMTSIQPGNEIVIPSPRYVREFVIR